jgi:hypothetical protein
MKPVAIAKRRAISMNLRKGAAVGAADCRAGIERLR